MFRIEDLFTNRYAGTGNAYRQNTRGRKTVASGAGKSAPATYHLTIDAPLLKQSRLKEFGRKLVLTESEETELQNNLFRNAKANILNLDSLVPNYNEESCFRGTISEKGDVDYYQINTVWQWFSHRPVFITMDAPQEGGCRMTLYDSDGNQVGISEENGDGTQTLRVPCDWSDSKAFTLKIEGNGQAREVPYKLTFRQGEVDPGFLAALNSKKNLPKAAKKAEDAPEENEQTFLDANKLRKEKNAERIQELHEKQYGAILEKERYLGEETVDGLLVRKKNGERLSAAEEEYVRIYGKLREVAETENALRTKDTAKKLEKKLSAAGIYAPEGMRIAISSDGSVRVSGGTEEENRLAERVIREEGMEGELRTAYFSVSETVKDMPDDKYRIALYTDELNRVLSKASGGQVSVDDVRIVEKKQGNTGVFYLEGLPPSLDRLINEAKTDSVYEDYYKKLFGVLEYREGRQEKPEFHVEIGFGKDGSLLID